MIDREKDKSIYTILANKYNIPHQVVEVICNHPFKFANRVISDDDDLKTIMFGYLFKIKIKNKFLKEWQDTHNSQKPKEVEETIEP